MTSELKRLLQKLASIERKSQKNIFKEGEVQEEINEISDFSELQDEIHQDLSLLQHANKSEVNTILRTLLDVDGILGSCTSNIRLTQDLVKKLITHLSTKKTKTDA